MKVQSSSYIPVNRFSKDDLIKEEIKLTKDIVSNNNKIISNMEKEIKCRENIIANNNKVIAEVEKGLAELAPFKAYCIEQLRLNANTAYNSSNSITSELNRVDNLYNKVLINDGSNTPPPVNDKPENVKSKVSDFIKNVRELGRTLYKETTKWSSDITPYVEEYKNDYDILMKNRGIYNEKIKSAEKELLHKKSLLEKYNKSISSAPLGSRKEENEIDKIVDDIFRLEQEITTYKNKSISETQSYMDLIKNHDLPKNNQHKEILKEADFRLELGNTKEALNGYNKLIANRENKPVLNDYKPVEEKLRQASKLYMEFQPLIENLSISNALKMKLYCTGISAHTNGNFSLSKAEVLHMINNQFFYPSN